MFESVLHILDLALEPNVDWTTFDDTWVHCDENVLEVVHFPGVALNHCNTGIVALASCPLGVPVTIHVGVSLVMQTYYFKRRCDRQLCKREVASVLMFPRVQVCIDA